MRGDFIPLMLQTQIKAYQRAHGQSDDPEERERISQAIKEVETLLEEHTRQNYDNSE